MATKKIIVAKSKKSVKSRDKSRSRTKKNNVRKMRGGAGFQPKMKGVEEQAKPFRRRFAPITPTQGKKYKKIFNQGTPYSSLSTYIAKTRVAPQPTMPALKAALVRVPQPTQTA
jgi:hypothetical protein